MSQEQKLVKSFSTKDILAMAFGTMIGWGWIMLSGKWAADAGMMGAIGAYLVGAVLCVFIGLAYAELTPAIPFTGGSVVFSYKSMGYWAAVVAGLGTGLAYLGVAAWEGPAFATAIDYVFPIPKIGYLWTIQGFEVYGSWAAVAVVGSIILTTLNYRGAKEFALFQNIATVGLIAVGIIFLGGGLAMGDFANAQPMVTNFAGFASVLLMVPAMFVGFDVIPQSAGEMNVPLKKIPSLLIMSILAAAAWYILMILSTCLSAPTEIRVNGTIPVADAMAYNFGGAAWGKVCIVGAICGIVTSWNGFLYGAARVIYSLANAKMLPVWLGYIHPKFGTPTHAVLVCGIISTLSCFLGKGALVWFVDAASFGVVIMYGMVTLSFIVLRIKQPELHRPYKVPAFGLVAVMSVFVTLFFLYLYLPMGPAPLLPVEWLVVLGWFGVSFLLAIYAKVKYKDVTPREREILMFGEEYVNQK
ncbi:APC family permease [Clostridium aminobutyricum]|uniref:Amino acid permease n=1 Tax=Clostridium aminobutyricum TaxID=33953 RepID=A0A939IGB5_CLOAM|nr:APC family permease [Clostridium aminobutyricum]MBN7773035.1 amino acid permease [Clostridium aminobutyricum]